MNYAARYYSRRAALYGNDLRAVEWGSRRSQALRFSVLADIGRLRGASVLDVGCGLGDLLPWLRKHHPGARYSGIDVAPEMVALARRRFPRADFRVADPVALARRGSRRDYVLASGIFTKQRGRRLAAMRETVRALYALARKGVAFNVLSSRADARAAGEFHADPAATLAYCFTLTPWVVLRHDYHPGDFTVYLYRERRT